MFCIRVYKPGSVCATQANPFSGLARSAGARHLSSALPGLWAFLECKMKPRSVISATPGVLLHWTRSREQAGDLLGAGVCLREAIYRQLLILAREHHCLPKRRGDRERAAILASSLHAAGAIDDTDHQWLREAIEVGNA